MASNYNFNGPIPLGVNVEDNVNRALAHQRTHGALLLTIIFTSFFLSGCMMPSFWLDDSDFQDNLPDNSIQTYWDYWASDRPEVRSRKLNAAYRDDFLKMFPIGDQTMHAKGYLTDIGAKCEVSKTDTETLDTCVYRRKIKTYRGIGFLGANRSIWAEKLLMYEGWNNIIYKIKSTQNTITDINVEKTSEPIYIYTYTESPKEKEERIKQIENCRPPECIRNF